MRSAWLAVLVPLLVACGGSDDATDEGPIPFDYPRDGELRVNELQAKATHNSYHVAQPDMTVDALKYSEKPLDAQASKQGVRGFELDTQYVLKSDDFEVFHIGLVDEGTTCRKFVDCLKTLRAWSKKSPGHHPLFVQIEPKDTTLSGDTESYFQKLEAEILAAWPREAILTPDDVKGSAPTLREAILTNGWPTLGEARGKILFFVDNTGDWRSAYTHGDQSLDGRLMFVDSTPGKPYEATYVLNDPSAQAQAIADRVGEGFIVRTRADADNSEPFAGDTSRQQAAFASGAQIISTDYPAPVEGVDYVTEIPGGTPSRCNPVTAPAACASEDIENPTFIR